MNTLAIVYVNGHLQELLDEAAERRVAKTARLSLRQRIVSAASDVQARLAMPLDNRGTVIPKLSD